MRVDDNRIRKDKVADSKISGYVWTGPKSDERDCLIVILENLFSELVVAKYTVYSNARQASKEDQHVTFITGKP